MEVYKLINDEYIPIVGNPVWMPEIGLGIGKECYSYRGMEREWLFWYDEQGNRHLATDEIAQQEKSRADRLANR